MNEFTNRITDNLDKPIAPAEPPEWEQVLDDLMEQLGITDYADIKDKLVHLTRRASDGTIKRVIHHRNCRRRYYISTRGDGSEWCEGECIKENL